VANGSQVLQRLPPEAIAPTPPSCTFSKNSAKVFGGNYIGSKHFFVSKNLDDLVFEKSDQLLDLSGLLCFYECIGLV